MFDSSDGPPLARQAVDRDAIARDEAGAAAFDADPEARVLVVRGGEGRALLAQRVEGSPPGLALLRPEELPPTGLRVVLGRTIEAERGVPAGAPVELRVVEASEADAIEAETARWAGLRDSVTMLSARDAGLFTEAVALANWHDSHRFCPRCGAPAEPVQRGWAKRCTAEGGLIFPRTDPAVIVLVTDAEDRMLLGSNALWEQHRYSVLAGFVEPGENLEAAVVREIAEEAGLEVDRVEYLGSQPWPFPASLMLAFEARVARGVEADTARPDGEEILSLRWFDRDELAAAVGDIALPGRVSVARWMIERWYGGPLPESSW